MVHANSAGLRPEWKCGLVGRHRRRQLERFGQEEEEERANANSCHEVENVKEQEWVCWIWPVELAMLIEEAERAEKESDHQCID